MANQIALSTGVELAQIDGITSMSVEGEKIRIVFADGVEVSVGRSDINRNKFDIFFPKPSEFMLLLTGEVVVKRINEMAAKAAMKC